MKNARTTPQERSEEAQPQNEFEATLEELLSKSAGKIKAILESIKEPYRRTVLDRVTKSFQPESDDLCLDAEIKERIYRLYASLDRRTKLLIVALAEIRSIDGLCFESKLPHEQRLIERIDSDLEHACKEPFDDPDDVWLQGVWSAIYTLQQNI